MSKLPGVLISNLVVGSGAKEPHFNNISASLLFFLAGILIGWLLAH